MKDIETNKADLKNFKNKKIELGKNFCQNQSFETCSTLIIEEMSELTKELMKHIRGNDNREAIVEEMADVQLTLLNLINCLGVQNDINNIMDYKYMRSYERYVEPTLND